MMQGFVTGRDPAGPVRPLRYRVKRCRAGWSVVLNACATRPMPDRSRAEAVARALQAEADGLRHQPSRRWS